MTEEKATAPEAEQTPPEKAGDAKPEEAGAEEEARMKGLETQLQELQQGLSAKDIQHKTELERLTRDNSAETERRVTQAVQTAETRLAGQKREVEIAQLKGQIANGDEDAIGKLATLANEPLEQARQAEETAKIRADGQTSGWIEGYAASMNKRLSRLEPTDERRGEFTALWDAGKFEELEASMAQDETVKAGGTSTETIAELRKRLDALEKGDKAASEEETAMDDREDAGADLGGGSPGGADDNKRLLDPTTPIDELREIRARQRAGG